MKRFCFINLSHPQLQLIEIYIHTTQDNGTNIDSHRLLLAAALPLNIIWPTLFHELPQQI